MPSFQGLPATMLLIANDAASSAVSTATPPLITKAWLILFLAVVERNCPVWLTRFVVSAVPGIAPTIARSSAVAAPGNKDWMAAEDAVEPRATVRASSIN